MSNTIKLPYSKKYTGDIIQPIIEALVGMSLCHSMQSLSKNPNLRTSIADGLVANCFQLIINIVNDYIANNRSAVKVSTDKGKFVIESTIEPGLMIFLPFGVSFFGMFLLAFEKELQANPTAIKCINGWYQVGFPISTAILRAIDSSPEKPYKHTCKDAHKLILHHNHFHRNGICYDYTTYSRAADKSKTLFYIGNDEFQVLHNGEPVEVLDITSTNYTV